MKDNLFVIPSMTCQPNSSSNKVKKGSQRGEATVSNVTKFVFSMRQYTDGSWRKKVRFTDPYYNMDD